MSPPPEGSPCARLGPRAQARARVGAGARRTSGLRGGLCGVRASTQLVPRGQVRARNEWRILLHPPRQIRRNQSPLGAGKRDHVLPARRGTKLFACCCCCRYFATWSRQTIKHETLRRYGPRSAPDRRAAPRRAISRSPSITCHGDDGSEGDLQSAVACIDELHIFLRRQVDLELEQGPGTCPPLKTWSPQFLGRVLSSHLPLIFFAWPDGCE